MDDLGGNLHILSVIFWWKPVLCTCFILFDEAPRLVGAGGCLALGGFWKWPNFDLPFLPQRGDSSWIHDRNAGLVGRTITTTCGPCVPRSKQEKVYWPVASSASSAELPAHLGIVLSGWVAVLHLLDEGLDAGSSNLMCHGVAAMQWHLAHATFTYL